MGRLHGGKHAGRGAHVNRSSAAEAILALPRQTKRLIMAGRGRGGDSHSLLAALVLKFDRWIRTLSRTSPIRR